MEQHRPEFEIIRLIEVTLSAVLRTVESFRRIRSAAEWLRLLTDMFEFFFSLLFQHRPNPMCYFGARLNCLACHSALVVPEENRLQKGKKKKKNCGGHLLTLCNKKTILKDPQNLSKAVEPLYGPAAAMRGPFMSGPPWPD